MELNETVLKINAAEQVADQITDLIAGEDDDRPELAGDEALDLMAGMSEMELTAMVMHLARRLAGYLR